jgi:hypothetical protein
MRQRLGERRGIGLVGHDSGAGSWTEESRRSSHGILLSWIMCRFHLSAEGDSFDKEDRRRGRQRYYSSSSCVASSPHEPPPALPCPLSLLLLSLTLHAQPRFEQVILDRADIACERDVGDLDNDGDLDIVGIRNWNSAPTWIYRNLSRGHRLEH